MSYGGYVNTEELQQGGGKPSARMGLNQGATLVDFAYNPNSGAGGSALDGVDVSFQIPNREKPISNRYFPITRAYSKDGSLTEDPTHPDFKIAVEQLNGTLVDIASAIAGADAVKAALQTQIADFKAFVQILERVIKGTPGHTEKPLDIFLAYQTKLQGENTRTFLELPAAKTIKHGRWVIEAVNGEFIRDNNDKGISYKTAEGIPHPFKRSEWFAKSNFANPIIIRDEEEAPAENATTNNSSTGW